MLNKISKASFRIKRKSYNFWFKNVKPSISFGKNIQSNLKIDVLIPAIEKDVEVLPHVINGLRECVKHPIGKIMIVAPNSSKINDFCAKKSCQFVDENSVLPITKKDINYVVNGQDRSGWLFQQFLKWSGDILSSQEHYLVVDADTVFISPQVFEYEGKIIFNFADEYHEPYFQIYQRLLQQDAKCPLSLTSHQMLFERKKLCQLKNDIESKNYDTWYNSIIKNMDKKQMSCHSDYETYGQYVISKYWNQINLQYWFNLSLSRKEIVNISILKNQFKDKYKSLSFHSYNT